LLASLAMTNFQACREYFEAGRRRDLAALLTMQQELTDLTRELMAAVGPDVHIDAAFDKMLWRLHDERFPLRRLPPYHGASEEAFRRFAQAVRTKFPRWAP